MCVCEWEYAPTEEEEHETNWDAQPPEQDGQRLQPPMRHADRWNEPHGLLPLEFLPGMQRMHVRSFIDTHRIGWQASTSIDWLVSTRLGRNGCWSSVGSRNVRGIMHRIAMALKRVGRHVGRFSVRSKRRRPGHTGFCCWGCAETNKMGKMGTGGIVVHEIPVVLVFEGKEG